MVRARPLQRPPAPRRRGGQARRVAGRRVPPRVPVHRARRDAAAPHGDALPQPAGDGGRGADAGQPPRRAGPALGLRQDDARAAHGRVERRPAGDHGHRRADAQRPVPGPSAGLGHAGVALRGGARRRDHHARRVRGGRGRDGPLARALHDDGHRVDDGVPGRGAGDAAPVLGDLARRRRPPRPDRATGGAAHRRAGGGRRPPVVDHDPGGVRGRRQGQRGHRRLDQRRDPPARRSRAGWASRSRSTTSTRWAATSRRSSTSSPRGGSSWRTSATRAGCRR